MTPHRDIPNSAARAATLCAAMVAILPLAAAPPDGREASAVRIHYLPEVAYRGERSTIVLSVPAGRTVTAALGGRGLGGVSGGGERELNIVLPDGGILRLMCDDWQLEFRVQPPDDRSPLEVRGGCLYDRDGRPVVLLADHRPLPPEVDRRWQTLRAAASLFREDRPAVRGCTVLGGDWLAGAFPGSALGRAALTHVYAGQQVSELNAFAAVLPELAPLPAAVVALQGRDLVLGHGELPYRMKVEWILQALEARGAHHLFVISLPLDRYDRECFAWANPALQLAARANRAHFVDGGFEYAERIKAGAYLRTVLHGVARELRMP